LQSPDELEKRKRWEPIKAGKESRNHETELQRAVEGLPTEAPLYLRDISLRGRPKKDALSSNKNAEHAEALQTSGVVAETNGRPSPFSTAEEHFGLTDTTALRVMR
jgi:hypothetical protein